VCVCTGAPTAFHVTRESRVEIPEPACAAPVAPAPVPAPVQAPVSAPVQAPVSAPASLPTSSTRGEGFETCQDQHSCITFSLEVASTLSVCSSGSCEMTVCATLDLDTETCRKTGTISHTCVKEADTCNPSTFNIADSTSPREGEVGSVATGTTSTQCQTGAPGTTLQFLFKDGAGCDVGGAAALIIDNSPLSCQPRPEPSTDSATDPYRSCTGNAVGKECIWSYVLPSEDAC
jgi:hypothetical protein